MNVNNMSLLSSSESYGGGGAFSGITHVESEKFDQLSEQARRDIGFIASDTLAKVRSRIELEWEKENKREDREAHIEKLKSLFTEAGFDTVHVKVIENQYSSDAWYWTSPWITVTTSQGIITIGWRKRVINIDWSQTTLCINGEELFKGENTTTATDYIHAWSYEKAVEYLKKLKDALMQTTCDICKGAKCKNEMKLTKCYCGKKVCPYCYDEGMRDCKECSNR